MNILLNTPQNEFWRTQKERLEERLEIEVLQAADLAATDPAIRAGTRGMITYGFPGELLPSFPKLRLLATPITGLNHLPLTELNAAGTIVVNAHANGRWVAERALALLLAVSGKIVSGDQHLRAGRWHGFAAGEPPHATWRSLSEMTVAIVGTGSIGVWSARFLRPLGPRIIGVRRRPGTQGIEDGLFDAVGTDLDTACREADAVIVTLPSTPATVGLIGSSQLRALEGGILVNVGRGEVIDETALFRAVASGRIHCAIDTWYSYPDPPGVRTPPSRYPLESFENIVLSPHLGGYTVPATQASGEEVVTRIIEWAEAGFPDTVAGAVDMEAGY